jgi:hypothetical protein
VSVAGITEEQGDRIIDLLGDILSELQGTREDSADQSIVTELREVNSELFQMRQSLSTIDRNVNRIDDNVNSIESSK